MQIEKIEFSDFVNKGKWDLKGIQNFLKQHSKSKTAISVQVLQFYNEFYMGERVIKHATFYCRKHVLDAMKDMKIKGLAEVSKDALKIRFD